ncbi:MAG: LPXTG cell wall anchor domain-containing protein, partial [Candidatus Marinimicrobia bacterium]|nr:LPXTG cell wall anchor domain-containing protein [Candidatus Neomarinimicrobiota bacterium]
QSANVKNIESGKNYVQNLNADGGTEALGALIAAMGMQQPDYLNLIIFLTDGSVGNESRIISTINRHLGKSRLFSVGIGSAPNRHLLEQVSRHGKGSFTYISSPSEVNEKMGNLIAKIDNPVITDLKLNILAQSELFPDPLPDLFINEPVVVFGKLRENYGQTGILTGRVNDKLISLDIPVFQLGGIENSGIPYLWARKKIDNLTTKHRLGDKEAKPEIIDLAIQYNLMSKFTSFVAVEHKIVNPKGEMLSSVFPTDLAKGLNFDKFFSKNTSIQLAELPQTATQYPLYVLIGLILISLSLLINIRYVFAKV